MPSPWEAVLGAEIERLDPRLRRYVAEIPAGGVGRGRGTFAWAGTRRRALAPLVRIGGRGGVAFGEGEHGVPFSIENRAVRLGRGRAGVAGRREFRFRRRVRVMHDLIAAVPGEGGPRLVDRLGRRGTVLAELDARVEGGGLVLCSRAVHLRLGPLRLRVPAPLAPRIRLDERIGADGRQNVGLDVRLPLLGSVYGYAGAFDYSLDDAEGPE